MQYRFKWLEELGWAALIAVSMTILTELVLFDPNEIQDWKIWAINLGAAAIRAAAGAMIAIVNKIRRDA